MPTESNRPSRQDLNFDAPGVLAVREDEGQPPEFISQPFDFRVRYQSPGLVLFHLAVALTAGVAAETATKPTVYLQMTADQIHSLKKTNHDTADTNSSNPPFLETVRRRLNGIRSVTRLKFRLYSGKWAKLIVPLDFTTQNASGDLAFEAAESLAVASLFSLYFRHDILAKENYGVYQGAIRQFPDLSTTAKQKYEAMIDLSRLYHGAGGKEHKPREHRGLRPARHRCSSPALGTPASRFSGSTLPFDETPSRQGHRGLLPPYDECVGEEQSPSAVSEAASLVAVSLGGGDCDPPPEYGDTGQRDDVLDPSQRVLAYGNKDGEVRPTSKRKRSITSVCTARTTSPTDAPRPEKFQRSLVALSVDQLMLVLDEQQRQINRLHRNFEESQRRNKELETRCDELEGKCYELENRQAGNEGSLEIMDIAIDELQAKCNALEDRMPDVCDEFRDLMEDMGRTAKEDICKTIDDSVAQDIEEIVDARFNKVKGKIWKALESI
ncbi:hypothetical protein LZ30DRAFT_787947 [Colletotrichum cereale]|nr:hypothetical protein LZ30DRAFT_787947 [Colletotrichum cereale]